jgi:hypothetical protein
MESSGSSRTSSRRKGRGAKKSGKRFAVISCSGTHAETAPICRYKRCMKLPANGCHQPSQQRTPLEEVVTRMPALARVIANSCLTPLMEQHPCLRGISSEAWDFFVPIGAVHAGMDRLRVTLGDPDRVDALHGVLTSSLENWQTNAPRALRDCEQFVLKAPDRVLLFDAIGAWVLWNVFQRQPTDSEFRVAPVLGVIFREFSRDLTSTTA